MNILDLNHLEAVEGNDVVGGYGYKNIGFYKDVDINIKENLKAKKKVKSKVDAKGNLAFAEGDADAYGHNTVAEAITYTVTDQDYYSGAVSNSLSGSN